MKYSGMLRGHASASAKAKQASEDINHSPLQCCG